MCQFPQGVATRLSNDIVWSADCKVAASLLQYVKVKISQNGCSHEVAYMERKNNQQLDSGLHSILDKIP